MSLTSLACENALDVASMESKDMNMAAMDAAGLRRRIVFMGGWFKPGSTSDFEMAAVVVRSITQIHRPVEVISEQVDKTSA